MIKKPNNQDISPPTTIGVGSLIHFGKKEYKIKNIDNSEIELEPIERDKHGGIIQKKEYIWLSPYYSEDNYYIQAITKKGQRVYLRRYISYGTAFYEWCVDKRGALFTETKDRSEIHLYIAFLCNKDTYDEVEVGSIKIKEV